MTNLALVFNFEGNKLTLQCKDTEVIGDVFNKFCTKASLDPNEVKFYFNSFEIKKDCGKTVRALNLKTLTTFDVVRAKIVIGA